MVHSDTSEYVLRIIHAAIHNVKHPLLFRLIYPSVISLSRFSRNPRNAC